MSALLEIKGLSAGYGRIPVLHGVECNVHDNEILGILGNNGMGKSTAFNALSGRITPNLGDWLDQDPDWNNVIDALPKGELRDFFISVRESKGSIQTKFQQFSHLCNRIEGVDGIW